MIRNQLRPSVSDRRSRWPSALPFSVATQAAWAWVVTFHPQTPSIFLLFHSSHPQTSKESTTATATSIPSHQNNHHQHQHHFFVSLLYKINLGFFTYLPSSSSSDGKVPLRRASLEPRDHLPGEETEWVPNHQKSRRWLFTDSIYRFKIRSVDQRGQLSTTTNL